MTTTRATRQLSDSLVNTFQLNFPGADIPSEIQTTIPAETSTCFYVEDDIGDICVPDGVETVVMPNVDNTHDFSHFTVLPPSIKELYLGHDGVLNGTAEDIRKTIAGLPNLKTIHYCGYYMDQEVYEHLLGECVEKQVELNPIF